MENSLPILNKINLLREKLNTLVSIQAENLTDDNIVEVSMELDNLINNYMKTSYNTNKSSLKTTY